MYTIYRVGDVMVCRGPPREDAAPSGEDLGAQGSGEDPGSRAQGSGEDLAPRSGEDPAPRGDHLPPWHPGFSIAAFLPTREANRVSSELFFDVVPEREVAEKLQAISARLVANEVLRNHFISHSFSNDVEVVRPPSNFLELVEECFKRRMINRLERNVLRRVNSIANKAVHDVEW